MRLKKSLLFSISRTGKLFQDRENHHKNREIFVYFCSCGNMCSFQDASVEELQEHKKELENKVQPIIGKLYKDQGAPPPEGAAHGEDKDEL